MANTSASGEPRTVLRRTPLHGLHKALGAKLVAFAGYEMPVNYPAGIIAEHQHTRTAAGLFDVSHMGQVRLSGSGVAAALESLVPGDITGLARDHTRYTLFTNDAGGILDDLMVTNRGDHLFLVVNAACKEADVDLLKGRIGDRVEVREVTDRVLLALQGPAAASVVARFAPAMDRQTFMTFVEAVIDGVRCWLTRSGYTGEDGFEISAPAEAGERLARRLLSEPEVKPAGLGARDSLRLEAGLCLYGHDIDQTTTPIEAGLAWAIGKRRRSDGGFPGASIILAQLANGPPRKRVGLLLEDRAPAREGTAIIAADGKPLGEVTSGGFSPTLSRPIAMGYVTADAAAAGTAIQLVVRGVPRPARIVKLPFVPQRYYRG